MRAILAAAVLATALAAGPAGATHCDSNPQCNHGRGSVIHHICLRSEVNPLTNEFNGRVCYPSPDQDTYYVYVRWIANREPVTICENGRQVYPPRNPPESSTCRIVTH